MLRSLLLTTALLAGLAGPTFAQGTNTPARPGTTMPPLSNSAVAKPPATNTVKPAATAVTPVKPTVPAPSPTPAPTAPVRPMAAAPVSGAHRIDINSASESELASLPGIGPVTAKAIVQGRPWDDLSDLVKKKVMAQATYDKNKDRFALADINKSSVADMAKTLPGIGDARARKIAAGRPYSSPEELVTKKAVTQKEFEKLRDVITY